MESPGSENAFTIERVGGVTVIVAAPPLERMEPALVEGASALMLEPVRSASYPVVLFDLGRIQAFGSSFLALMIRCWKHVQKVGGQMAVCGASDTIRELLRITSLDTVWPIYETRPEALAALLEN